MHSFLTYLWLIPALPMTGFIILVGAGEWLSKRMIVWIGVGSVGLSAGVAALVTGSFIASPPAGGRFTLDLWTWMEAGPFTSRFAFDLDALSLVMVLVITWVGFLIHVYSSDFMADDAGYRRFFAYMNLFVAAMLVLVLGDNLFLLYLGWEGVGLCSYLLIGFWYEQPANGWAARKAFIITRIGDTALAVGIFLLFASFGTVDIQDLMGEAARQWDTGSPIATAAAALLLIGAMGKSAQVPLHTWLPDAMAGPTPVSALIHAATMVTAGVYLLARTQVLIQLAPAVQTGVAVIGAITLLVAALSALVQRDIKRVLAYSTISQIGYMFLALGVAAPAAAMFHFLTHACFKALLFLGAGAVSNSLHHELDMFRMGGLRRRLPVTFWTFLAGVASLAGLPLVTAGFYSKDWVLWETWTSPQGGLWLWIAGAAGAFLTSLYGFRLLFFMFFGEAKTAPHGKPGPMMAVPLVVLAGLSLVTGFLELPRTLGDWPLFSGFLQTAMPLAHAGATASVAAEAIHQSVLGIVSLAGVGIAYLLYRAAPERLAFFAAAGPAASLRRFWFEGWEFDRVYDRVIVRPFIEMARTNRTDAVDALYTVTARVVTRAHAALSATQTGSVRWYATVVAGSGVLFIWYILT
ncbi:MAG TPA: NADH-quinone oxidoreductase subunit L [Nitrospiraceae bacterium]|nr:NADH-quinone oxidoreductase subunit L [Nitrospiraceae bacterium]